MHGEGERRKLVQGTRAQTNNRVLDSVMINSPQNTHYDSEENIMTSVSSQFRFNPERSYCRTSRRRIPKGKGVLLVYLTYFLESLAFYISVNGLQLILVGNRPSSVWIFTLLDGTAGRILYPIAGIIADAYLGRYQVIHIGLWLLWVGFSVLAFSQSLSICSVALPIISAVFISVGSGSVEVNAISFGVDQLSQGATSDEISSYFFFFYIIRNAGNLCAALLTLALNQLLNNRHEGTCEVDTVATATSLLSVLAVTVALIVNFSLKNVYFRNRKRENPLPSIIRVLYYSATVKRHLPVYRRTFRYGEERKPRIELAKIEFDGIFPSSEVEDVKTFCRITFLCFTLIGYFITFGAVYSMLGYEIDRTSKSLGTYNYLTSEILTFINVLTYIIFLPILNQVLIPFICHCNMRFRIGLGLIFIVLSHVTSIYLRLVKSTISRQNYLWWIFLPALLINIGDALTIVTFVEFIYAQSPESMKGLLTGLLYLEYGVFNGAAAAYFHYYPKFERPVDSLLYFYASMATLGAIGVFGYIIAACLYSNRQRPTDDDSEEELIRRRFANNVYSR